MARSGRHALAGAWPYQACAPAVGGEIGRTHISFSPVRENFWTTGADVTLDTRRDPAYPSDAVLTSAPWSRLNPIGATSFGGAVPYLRGSLVSKRQWVSDKEFVELLSISQSLPGLNATNMAILVGQKLKGALGAAVAVLGICLPGSFLMLAVGIIYRAHGDHAWATGALKGVAAASVGLVLFRL